MSCPPLLTSEEIAQIVALAYQAGQIALNQFRNANPQIKPDQTFLTNVDLEIEHFLAGKLKSIYPTHNFIGEEGIQNRVVATSPYIWIIDPIDGTTAFIQGLPGWGISIGLLYDGQPCFGLFYMPLLDDLTYTTHEGAVYCNGLILRHTIRNNWEQKDFLAINATAHTNFQIKTRRTRALGSIGANLVYTARGTAAGAFIPKAHVWDLVSGAAILSRVGGETRYTNGNLVNYEELLDGQLAPTPIIAAHPDLQADLRNKIHARASSQ